MPTDNRSSNTEMVSVPRERLRQFIEYSASVCKSPAWVKDKAALVAALEQPAPQPHPDPIAWMVGTAFWWTKEEAERDAAETGLPIVGVGSITDIAPAQQHQGEPVAVLYADGHVLTKADCGDVFDICCKVETPLYTHADPAEVERLRADIETMRRKNNEYWHETEVLRAHLGIETARADAAVGDANDAEQKLAEAHALLRDVHGAMREYEQGCDQFPPFHHNQLMDRIDAALSASAEPSAPTHDPKLISIVHTPPAEYDEP